MDMRRMLPFLLIAFALLFILPSLFRHSSSTTLSTKARGTLTIDAINRIDRIEQRIFAARGTYTADLADVAARDKVLAAELTTPLAVNLDVTGNGKGYLVRVASDVISLAAARSGKAVTTRSCSLLKSGAGVSCPPGTTAPTTTTTTVTTPTATTTSTTGTTTTAG